jgi:hypothetical protein
MTLLPMKSGKDIIRRNKLLAIDKNQFWRVRLAAAASH